MGTEIVLILALIMALAALGFCLRSRSVLRSGLKSAEQEIEKKSQEYFSQSNELAACRTRLEVFQESRQKWEGEMRLQFENLANQIFENKSRVFSERSERELGRTLTPLKEQIREFEKSVEEKYAEEAKERHTLKAEIEKLTGTSDKMTAETTSLINALRGDSKIQGDWGEMILEKILESSGLREGEEYELQKSYKNEDGRFLRPDVVIHLPEGKQIVVDSKVSLTAYERHVRTGEEGDLREHIRSVKNHVKELGEKDYSRLDGVRSPEFVFMFIPVEPAYMAAIKGDAELSTWAWKKGVAVVTSTTLLTGLKTVASVWRLEKQNRNAKKIAEEGGRLYDKFVLFLDDFEKIGKTFQDGRRHYDKAMERLQTGRGNVFKKMEELKALGAATGKHIDRKFLE